MRLFLVALASVTLSLGCDRHEEYKPLVRSLAEPVRLICTTQRKEGAGCFGDCATRLQATDGRAYLQAAGLLAQLPDVPGGKLKSELGDVRRAAAALVQAMGAACSKPLDKTVTDDVVACAAKSEASRALAIAVRGSVGALAAAAKRSAGVELPSAATCPRVP